MSRSNPRALLFMAPGAITFDTEGSLTIMTSPARLSFLHLFHRHLFMFFDIGKKLVMAGRAFLPNYRRMLGVIEDHIPAAVFESDDTTGGNCLTSGPPESNNQQDGN